MMRSMAEKSPDQPDLLEDHQPGELPLPVDAANLVDPGKRGPGRPSGATNKRDREMADYLLALGYRDPMHGLAALYSMRPVDLAIEIMRQREELAKWMVENGRDGMAEKLLNAEPPDIQSLLELQEDAKVKSLPYWHAKQTPTDATPQHQLAVMNIGQFNVNAAIDDNGRMSLGVPMSENIVDIQGVSEAEEVRQTNEKSHDEPK